jgi:hypothetical protein
MSPPHGKRGLAHPGGAFDHRDRHRPVVRTGDERVQLPQGPVPTGETSGIERQLPRSDHRGRRAGHIGGTAETHVVPQHGELEFGQLCRQVETGFVGEQPLGPLVGLERFRRALAAVQGKHPQSHQAMSGGVFGRQRDQLIDDRAVPPQPQFRVEPVFQGCQPCFFQVLTKPFANVDRGQCGPLPQGQRLVDEQNTLLVIREGACFGHDGPEHVRVDAPRIAVQNIAWSVPAQRHLVISSANTGQGALQPADVGLDHRTGTRRRGVRPDEVDEPRGGHQLVDFQQQHREHEPLLTCPQIDLLAIHPSPHGPQQLKLHTRSSPQHDNTRVALDRKDIGRKRQEHSTNIVLASPGMLSERSTDAFPADIRGRRPRRGIHHHHGDTSPGT